MDFCIEKKSTFFDSLVGSKIFVEELFDSAIWAEGPAWDKKRKTLIFSDVRANKMYFWNEEKGVNVFRYPSHYSNGNCIDNNGNLVSCEHGRRCISFTELEQFPNEMSHLLVDKIDGKKLNSPNDIVVKSDGTIWFTDPPYGILSNDEGQYAPSEIIGCYVYCFNPHNNFLNIATFNVMRPNGLAFTADEKKLVVADMSIVDFKTQGLYELISFDVEDNKLTNRTKIVDITPGIPDGFCLNKNNLIFCSCGNGLLILTIHGDIIGRIILNKCVSNCCFGDDEKTLFVTASNSLYRIKFL